MSEISTAVPALEGRIRDWITVQGGLLIVREPDGKVRSEWHVMPATVPWIVTCQGGAVSIVLGSWTNGDRESVGATYTRNLSFTRLPESNAET